MAAVLATPRMRPAMPFSSSRGAVPGRSGLRRPGLGRVDGGDDVCDRDPAAGDDLGAAATKRCCEGPGPAVLVDDDPGGATRLEYAARLRDVVLVQKP